MCADVSGNADLDPGAVLAALADPTRRALFEALVQRPCTVGELAAGRTVSRPAVSQHLKALREAGLVEGQPQGRQVRYAARPGALGAVRRYLDALAADLARAQDVPPAPRSVAEEDRLDAAMTQWATGSLAHDPHTVAVIVRLMLVARLMEARCAATCTAHGVNLGEAVILGTLQRVPAPGGLTPGTLARSVLIKPPGVAKRLERLQSHGLIVRNTDPHDRRSHRVRLTRKGRTVADAIADEQLGRHYAAVFALPQVQLDALDRVLRLLRLALEGPRPGRSEAADLRR